MKKYGIYIFFLVVAIVFPNFVEGRPFIAYSLKEAQNRLVSKGMASDELLQLGGITVIAGMVYDDKNKDLIIVGQGNEQHPKITLDDFVVAMRALLMHKENPLVSIDRTSETSVSHKQVVRFQGGVENTRLGKDMLEADIILKKIAFGKLPAEIWGVKSYLSMSAEQAQSTKTEDRINSRFWFVPIKSSLALREGVFAFIGLNAGIETEVVYAEIDGKRIENPSEIRDKIGDVFANQLVMNLSDLAIAYPALKQIMPIIALANLAEGMKTLQSEVDLNYWLYKYKVPRIETPEFYELIEVEQNIENKGMTLYLSGGIEINPLVVRLDAGDVTALKEAVLNSRPSGHALIWNPPLDGWHIPGTENLEIVQTGGSSARRGGFSVERMLERSGQTTASITGKAYNYNLSPPKTVTPKFDISQNLPPQRYSPNVGGVMLQGVAKVSGAEHAKVDLAIGNFSLIVDGQNARLDPEAYRKFITALWAVYYSNEDPGISIDPIGCFYFDPYDPERDKKLEECLKRYEKKEEKHMVRYIGKVINTDLGRVMREADYVMKKWSVGTEKPGIPGFKSPDEYRGWKETYSEGSSRFWFVPEGMKFKRGGDMLLFEDGRMTVKTEYTFRNEGDKQADPDNEKFAGFFSEHYDGIAQKYPVYKELFEYAKMVSLAKYLKEQGIPMFWFLMANKDLVLTEDSPGTVDALAKGSDYYRNLYIMGGVDLGFDVKQEGHYVYDQQAVSAINEAVSKLPSNANSSTSLSSGKDITKTVSESFSFDLGKNTYTVVPQHSLTSGKDRRGNRYQTDMALRGAGFQLTEDSLNQFKSTFFRRDIEKDINPILESLQKCSAMEKLNASEEERCKRLEAELKVKIEKAEKRAETISDKLKSLKGEDFKDENRFSRALDESLGKEDIQFKPLVMKLAYYKANLELVRYFKPGQQDAGEFGKGWRLLIPYRIKTVDDTVTEFQGYTIKRNMAVENLLTGEQEVLVFNADRYSVAGYVPEKLESSQVVGLFLMSDASYRLADKLGNEFGFDQAGYLTDMIFSEENHIHVEYLDKFTSAFDKTPYQIQPADGEQMEFLNVSIPKWMTVKNLISGDSENLIFSDKGELAGYVPEDAEKSRYKIMALMSDASFRLLDKKEHETVFGPSWTFDGKFKGMAFPDENRMVSSVSQGNQKISFKYTMDRSGDVMIASANLSQGQEINPVYAVTYYYDDEGRLFSVKGEDSKVAELKNQPRDKVMTANK